MQLFSKHDKAETPVSTVKIHHESNFVDRSDSFENWKNFIFEQVAWYLPDKNLAAFCRWFSLIVWRRTEFSLAVFLDLRKKIKLSLVMMIRQSNLDSLYEDEVS